MFYISYEEILDIYDSLGYSPVTIIHPKKHGMSLFFKYEEQETKLVFCIKTTDVYARTLDAVKAIANDVISKTRFNAIDEDHLFIVIWGMHGTNHHYIGKNVCFVCNQTVQCLGYSTEMKNEANVLFDYKRRKNATENKAKAMFPERYRSGYILLIPFIAFMVYLYITNIMNPQAYGYSVDKVLDKDWTTLISYMFMHLSIAHLVGNMTSLWLLGRVIMQIEGYIKFAIIYLMSGFIGAFIDCILIQLGFGNPSTITVGASGAIFGLMGAILVECYTDYGMETDRRRWLKFILFSLIASNLNPAAVNVKVHLAGFIVGIFVTIAIKVIDKSEAHSRLSHSQKKEAYYIDKINNRSYKRKLPDIDPDHDNHSFDDCVYRLSNGEIVART